jgi:hypothetical protein
METTRVNFTELVKNSVLYKEFSAEREEILSHKWIESEKAGYDIGFERALVDWILKYRSAWRAKRQREVKFQQRYEKRQLQEMPSQLIIGFSPVKVTISFPLCRSQSRSVRSQEAETVRRPHDPVWLLGALSIWPLSRLQNRNVPCVAPNSKYKVQRSHYSLYAVHQD